MALAEAEKKHREKKGGAEKSASLSSAERQEEILKPKSVKVELFGDEVELHPLPAKWSLQFAGFTARVMGASQESAGVFPLMRISGVLAERYSEDFLRYVARATSPTSLPVPEQQIDLLVAEMSEKLDASQLLPLAKAFLAITAQNKTFEALGVNTGTGSKNS